MDFVNEEEQSIKVEGKTWKYKPITAGQENSWLMEYFIPVKDDEGNFAGYRQDFGILNKCKMMRNLTEVPYTKEEIKQQTGIDKDWKEMSEEERWKLLSKLHPSIFSKVVGEIEKIDNPKKKSS